MRPERARPMPSVPSSSSLRRQLRRDGRLIALTPKAFDTLHALAAAGGRALSKEDLVKAVWPDTNLWMRRCQNIFALRRALGASDHIEAVPKFGYRLTIALRGSCPTTRSCWSSCHSKT